MSDYLKNVAPWNRSSDPQQFVEGPKATEADLLAARLWWLREGYQPEDITADMIESHAQEIAEAIALERWNENRDAELSALDL